MQRAWFLPVFFVALCAQQPAQHPSYDAASLKINNSGSGSSSSNGSRGQVLMVNQSLKRLIERAYNVKPFQVMGPDWLESAHFDLAAKYPPDTPPAEHAAMLRTLLEERFKLQVHRETKELPGYALIVTKGGFKLKPVETGESGSNSNGDGTITTYKATKITIAQFADYIARHLGETVIDKTGIEGAYDVNLRFGRDDTPADVETAPPLTSVIQEVLGLRLQAQKVPVEIIVVDHAERVPIE